MSELTKSLGEVLTAVTEDSHRIILTFENGRSVSIYPHGNDSHLEVEAWHSPGCKRRAAVSGACSCVKP